MPMSKLERQHAEACAAYYLAQRECDRLIAEGATEEEAEAKSGDLEAFESLWGFEDRVLLSDDVGAIWRVLARRYEITGCVLGELATVIGEDLPGLI